MSNRSRWENRPPLAERSVKELGAQIVAKSEHVGGGSAAAASGSLAAATAQLVVALSIRRSTPAELADRLKATSDRLAGIRTELMDAGDADEQVLDALMAAYRARGEDQEIQLEAAAQSTLRIAALALEVVEIAAGMVEFASRFTASDLGAAASIAHGAVDAACMTARINIIMMEDLEDGNARTISELRSELERIEKTSSEMVEIARTRTRQRLEKRRQSPR